MNPFPQYFVWSNFKKVMGSLKSTTKISERKENAIIRNIVCAHVCIYIYQWKVRIQYIYKFRSNFKTITNLTKEICL